MRAVLLVSLLGVLSGPGARFAFGQMPQQELPHLEADWLERLDHGRTALTEPRTIYWIYQDDGQVPDRETLVARAYAQVCGARPVDAATGEVWRLPIEVDVLVWRRAPEGVPAEPVPPVLGGEPIEIVPLTRRYPAFVMPPIIVERCGPEA